MVQQPDDEPGGSTPSGAELHDWELNPAVRWAVGRLGLPAVLGLKFAGLTFAVGMAAYCRRHRRRLEWPLTGACATAYVLLSLYYVVGSRLPEPASGQSARAGVSSKGDPLSRSR